MKRYLLLILMLSASTAYGEIYTWTDARGTAFYTNSLDEIPARYLKKARVLDVATGKKGALATPHVASQPPAQPGATPGQPLGQPGPAPAPMPSPAAAPATGTAPAVVAPSPPAAPPRANYTVPQTRARESGQRRSHRRRDYNLPEEE